MEKLGKLYPAEENQPRLMGKVKEEGRETEVKQEQTGRRLLSEGQRWSGVETGSAIQPLETCTKVSECDYMCEW